MEVKKIRADSMREALFKVKKEMGIDAVILHTRTVKNKGLFGFAKREYVEIVASKDVGLMEIHSDRLEKEKQEKKALSRQKEKVQYSKEVAGMLKNYEKNVDLDLLKEDISWIKDNLDDLVRRVKYQPKEALSTELAELYVYLLEQEVAQDLAMDLVQKISSDLSQDRLNNQDAVKQEIKNLVASLIRTCEPIQERGDKALKIAFVGPTGVGKTTTIAKLAADFSLVKKKKVSVITIDTYRIAAVEQIKTYMDIMGIPVDVVMTPHEMVNALEKNKDSDIILIDTAGRSQNNRLQMKELNAFIEAASPDEVHLVLSTTTNYKNTIDIVEKFTSIRIDKLLFTKLDEAVNFGLVLNVMAKVQKALSYITIGQAVPDDIEAADVNSITNMIVGDYGKEKEEIKNGG